MVEPLLIYHQNRDTIFVGAQHSPENSTTSPKFGVYWKTKATNNAEQVKPHEHRAVIT